jgi:hypothetical protein
MTVLDAFHLAVYDDGELVRPAAAGDARPRHELIAPPYVALAAQPRAALPLSPYAFMACGGWAMSDTSGGATA